ncbi:MAG: ATP-binding cassette domain-containing protein, partial [Defluviitaleaceae bacterium]|nr:ATP-binding cassette domain-containing protein [Defluviitaleaceae bacterium]
MRVPQGCICGFLGKNGAGKTTTIRMLAGL